jgi:GTP diphosphokinase / guanosine-3',5'-bis(diphosphate) 3'-diphosphatase
MKTMIHEKSYSTQERQLFEELIQSILLKDKTIDIKALKKTYIFAQKAYKNAFQTSGQPFILHVLRTAHNILDMHIDLEIIEACLLHDIFDTTDITLSEMQKHFSPNIIQLISNMHGIKKMQRKNVLKHKEDLRNILAIMTQDLRVIFIQLAESIDRMKTLKHETLSKQKQKADEVLHIYVPIAEKLGMYDCKQKLEDLAFPFLYQKEYKKITQYLEQNSQIQNTKIHDAILHIQNILPPSFSKCDIHGRIKNMYSIFRKMHLKKKKIEEMYDIFALRIIVDNSEQCYAILGILHAHFVVMQNRIKDYISTPKPNGYQSLHTTVLGILPNTFVEIQIRTHAMHKESEQGIAAHFDYKHEFDTAKKNHWTKKMQELQDDYQDIHMSPHMKILDHYISIMTINGNTYNIKKGSTVLDFAFYKDKNTAIHCQSFLINGEKVPFSYKLEEDDIIDTIMQEQSIPSLNWLNYVHSKQAKQCIKNTLENQSLKKRIKDGRHAINNHLSLLHLPIIEKNLSNFISFQGKKLTKNDAIGIITQVGSGHINPSEIICELLQSSKSQKKISIIGRNDIPYSIAKCCHPDFSDDIIASINTQQKIYIHKINCNKIQYAKHLLPAYFSHKIHNYKIHFTLQRDYQSMSNIISFLSQREDINIIHFSTPTKVEKIEYITLEVTVQCKSYQKIDIVLQEIKNKFSFLVHVEIEVLDKEKKKDLQ